LAPEYRRDLRHFLAGAGGDRTVDRNRAVCEVSKTEELICRRWVAGGDESISEPLQLVDRRCVRALCHPAQRGESAIELGCVADFDKVVLDEALGITDEGAADSRECRLEHLGRGQKRGNTRDVGVKEARADAAEHGNNN
jgi:hypothetical protein